VYLEAPVLDMPWLFEGELVVGIQDRVYRGELAATFACGVGEV
jgi:hypothetical protein